MRISEAAERLGTSPRMLRYRDQLGLLPPVRPARPASRRAPAGGPTAPGPATPGRTPAVPAAEGGPTAGKGTPAAPAAHHRHFTGDDLAAVALALRIEQRYDISPAALAFGLKVLADPVTRADVAELARRLGQVGPPPARALEFEKERALRLLRLAPDRPPARGREPRPR